MAARKQVGRVAWAVAGQLTQALASFVLQVLAARALGAAGLGTYALLFSVIVMVASVSNGVVGDSLTVLDRGDPPLRAALQNWNWLTAVVAGVVAAAVFVELNTLSVADGVIMALATATYMVETVLRRLLMATMRFWALAAVDLSGLLAAVVMIVLWKIAHPLNLTSMIAALAVGQAVASAVAIVCLPRSERWAAPFRPADMLVVARFGGIRAAQQFIRPSLLTAARSMATIAAGRAAFGQLEAARVYMAPALLVVQGLGSYLFSSYARGKAAPMAALLRRADRASGAMLVATLAIGGIGTAAAPWAARIVTGSSFSVERLAVFGWAVFAASTAMAMPYASLAAVRGRQRVVLGLSVLIALITAGVIALLVLAVGVELSAIPFLLAAGSFAQGYVVRSGVLKPLLDRLPQESAGSLQH